MQDVFFPSLLYNNLAGNTHIYRFSFGRYFICWKTSSFPPLFLLFFFPLSPPGRWEWKFPGEKETAHARSIHGQKGRKLWRDNSRFENQSTHKKKLDQYGGRFVSSVVLRICRRPRGRRRVWRRSNVVVPPPGVSRRAAEDRHPHRRVQRLRGWLQVHGGEWRERNPLKFFDSVRCTYLP